MPRVVYVVFFDTGSAGKVATGDYDTVALVLALPRPQGQPLRGVGEPTEIVAFL